MWDLKDYRYAANPAEAVALMRRGPGRGAYIAGGTDMLLFSVRRGSAMILA